ncbi:hypothetical protein [Haloarchaeobius amylolyticus]|uniref:hypothetical protein n=1 Tax=Haloarchaeobius amylolyticus TaxID=1198296 RepID=UPI0022701A59|nr:hypothetical protein [Haloarchaeobius amylolyticus]
MGASATVTETPADVREAGLSARLRHLAERANPAFAVGSLAVPLSAFGLAWLVGGVTALFYVHVAAGALWFSFAVIFPVIIGPVLGGVDEDAAAQVVGLLTPKTVFFLFGISATTVLSGTALLDAYGQLGGGALWPTVALGAGWGLFVFGLAVPNRLHLRSYYEHQSPDPDGETLARVERLNVAVGLFELVVMFAIVYVMVTL